MYGPLRLTYCVRCFGFVRGKLHRAISRAMKPRSRLPFARLDELIDLAQRGEMVPGLGRG